MHSENIGCALCKHDWSCWDREHTNDQEQTVDFVAVKKTTPYFRRRLAIRIQLGKRIADCPARTEIQRRLENRPWVNVLQFKIANALYKVLIETILYDVLKKLGTVYNHPWLNLQKTF